MDYNFYKCLITHKETNVSWSVPAYTQSPEEALKYTRKTWTNEKMWDIKVSLDKEE